MSQFAFVMQPASFTIQKPVFLLLGGAFIVLCAALFFLYRDKQQIEIQNRQLIIQNDSIMSVNIILVDSVRERKPLGVQQKTMLNKGQKE